MSDQPVSVTECMVLGLEWAANHIQFWTAHFSTQEQRRIGDWLTEQIRVEAVRLELGLPDEPEGRAAAGRELDCRRFAAMGATE